jgi:hypothetical protein
MFWARHDPFFDLAEILSWMRALPRMETHVLDAGHKLLETHAAAAVSLILDFIRHVTPTPEAHYNLFSRAARRDLTEVT